MDIQLSIDIIALLIGVATIAGFIDAIAGGGGMLTIPALLLANIPPVHALGTNKLQACAGSFSASVQMIKQGIVQPKTIKTAIIGAFIGSAVGTTLLQLSPPQLLEKLLPLLIGAIAIYTLFAPNLGEIAQKPRVSNKIWDKCITPVIGFYDGYLGPGTGMFFALGNVALRGKQIIQATAQAKVLNFATNIASLIFFIFGDNIVWLAGFAMMFGQYVGAYFGSKLVVTKGAQLIRPLVVIMCFAMLVKYML